jgi:hypothetical protein
MTHLGGLPLKLDKEGPRDRILGGIKAPPVNGVDNSPHAGAGRRQPAHNSCFAAVGMNNIRSGTAQVSAKPVEGLSILYWHNFPLQQWLGHKSYMGNL